MGTSQVKIIGDHHYALLGFILASEPKGTAIEFGTGSGESGRLIAAQMPLVTFGSIDGLPEDWRPGFGKGSFAHPLPDIDNATIVEGLFADTLPAFNFAAVEPIGLVHCDADLYSSTKIALNHITPHIGAGTYIVFDEYHGYPQAEQHEQKAFREWVNRNERAYEVVGEGFEQIAVQLL